MNRVIRPSKTASLNEHSSRKTVIIFARALAVQAQMMQQQIAGLDNILSKVIRTQQEVCAALSKSRLVATRKKEGEDGAIEFVAIDIGALRDTVERLERMGTQQEFEVDCPECSGSKFPGPHVSEGCECTRCKTSGKITVTGKVDQHENEEDESQGPEASAVQPAQDLTKSA